MESTATGWPRTFAHAWISLVAICALAAQAIAQPEPGSCENALVVDGRVCLTDDETYECVTVESGGTLCTNGHTLTITAASGLTVEGSGELILGGPESPFGEVVLTGGGIHTIDGRIVLGSGLLNAKGTLLILGDNSVFDGDGKVVSDNSGARILIDAGVKFRITPGFTVEGALKIEGLFDGSQRGAFENDGLVHANIAAGTIHLMSNTALDGSDGDWRANTFETTVLRFSRAHTDCGSVGALTGDFAVADCACLDFDAEIRTSGGFTCDDMLGGCVEGTLIYECDTEAEGCGNCD